MKSLDEIKAEGKILNVRSVELWGVKMIAGEIYDRKEQIHFTMGRNEDGWEHVAISIGSGRKIPTWEIMCKAKSVFWRDDEDVVQLHPKENAYFHGFPKEMEVLHLWRPVDGDWSLLNKMFGADTQTRPVWIPVGDGMPMTDGKYICLVGGEARFLDYVNGEFHGIDFDGCLRCLNSSISHWMPLPAGPLT